MRTYFSFDLILLDIPNSTTPQNHPPPATDSACTHLYSPVQAAPPPLFPPPPPPLFRTEDPAKAGTCARDKRALQQLALTVHVKHSVIYTRWCMTFLFPSDLYTS